MSVQKELASAIDTWLAGKAGRTLNMLSRVAGVSYSSVRRAAQGEVEQEPDTVLSIASIVMGQQLSTFVSQYFPHLKRAVLDIRRGESNEDLAFLLQSDEYFKVVVLASARTGTNEDEIIAKFGENSLPYFDDLKNGGFLVQQDTGWRFDKDISNVSLELARRMLCVLAKAAPKKNDSIKNASMSLVGWESLKPEAAKGVYLALEEASHRVHSITSNPENHGNVLVTYGMLHSVLKGQEELS